MKNQALISSKDKSKKLKCRLLQFLFGALRVKKIYLRTSKVQLCTARTALSDSVVRSAKIG